METITSRLQAELVAGFESRSNKAIDDARLLVANSDRVADVLVKADPGLEAVARAMLELAAYVEETGNLVNSIRDGLQTAAGHAMEDRDLTRSHLYDLINIATIGINLPDALEAQPLGLEEIQAGATEGDVEQAIYRLAYKIRKAHRDNAGAGLRIGLVLESGE